MFENTGTTDIKELGEFGLIEHLTGKNKLSNKSSMFGVGDDCAVIDAGKDVLLVTTDMLAEGVHFNMMYSPPMHLGYKAVVVNISDVLAMNAKPEQITVSLGLSSRFTLDAVEEIYKGIYKACEVYGVDLVGGDTTSTVSGLVISITAMGRADKKKVAYRSGAKPNDLIIATGDYGAAYMGLQVLEREKAVFKDNPKVQPDLSGHDYILERQLKPEARGWLIEGLEKAGVVPTSMIDVSDGLASDVKHICKASEVGCRIYEEKIPIDYNTGKTAEDFQIAPITAALNGGEDYELLFTIDQKDYEKIQEIRDLHVIGHITDKSDGEGLITTDDKYVELRAQGWDHLKG